MKIVKKEKMTATACKCGSACISASCKCGSACISSCKCGSSC
ncbi:MAG: hypothetical protein ACFFBP_05660 [Promethearchaeota archaeon]